MLNFLKKLFSTNRTCELKYNDKVELLVDYGEYFTKGSIVEVKGWVKHGRDTIVLVRTLGEVETPNGFKIHPTKNTPRKNLKLVERSKEV